MGIWEAAWGSWRVPGPDAGLEQPEAHQEPGVCLEWVMGDPDSEDPQIHLLVTECLSGQNRGGANSRDMGSESPGVQGSVAGRRTPERRAPPTTRLSQCPSCSISPLLPSHPC